MYWKILNLDWISNSSFCIKELSAIFFPNNIFPAKKSKAVVRTVHITRFCLTNQIWLQWPPHSFSQILSFSTSSTINQKSDACKKSLHRTGYESASIDIFDSLQMLCHHWVVTWTTKRFKAAHYLAYSFIEKISEKLVPSLVLLHNKMCWHHIDTVRMKKNGIFLFFLLLFAAKMIESHM